MKTIACLVLLACSGTLAFAQSDPASPTPAAEPVPVAAAPTPPTPPDLGDPNPTLEINPEVSFYTGDAMRSFIAGGASVTYRFTRAWWASTEVLFGSAMIDPVSSLEAEDGDSFLVVNAALVWNVPLRMGLDDDSWYADMYTSVGPAYFDVGPSDAIGGFIGGGMTIHTPLRWLGFRADVKNFFYSLPNHGGQDFNSDLEIALGPVLQL